VNEAESWKETYPSAYVIGFGLQQSSVLADDDRHVAGNVVVPVQPQSDAARPHDQAQLDAPRQAARLVRTFQLRLGHSNRLAVLIVSARASWTYKQ